MAKFFEQGFLPSQWGKTYITLILKEFPVSVKDYRPIAFYDVVYKVISRILVMEGQLEGYRYVEGHVSHLLYANDLLLVARVNLANVEVLTEAMELYTILTNQKISKDKSVVFLLPWLEEETKNYLRTRLNLELATMPFTYLGRISLVKFTLSSIPYYWMGSTCISNSVLDEIEKIARSFIWEKSADQCGLHLISWEMVTSPKEEGDWGVCCLRTAKRALLGKHVLSVLRGRNTPWVGMVRSKYGSLDPWNAKPSPSYSWLWRALCQTASMLKARFQQCTSNIEDTKLLREAWCSSIPLGLQSCMVNVENFHMNSRVTEIMQSGMWDMHKLRSGFSNTVEEVEDS
ncbi:uncharacterized protein [Typha latifolia]|uniref:uncharacterized protein n=1 Tax=Typha latifolia TaxID=4733 RepID=UPI003C2FB93A